LARLPQPIAGAAPHTKATSYKVMISLLADLFMIGLSGCLGTGRIIPQRNSCDFYPASADILPNRKNKRHSSRQA
jgi:hypothetical protein